jgi:tetratricopeptide (TPR) repeat protein
VEALLNLAVNQSEMGLSSEALAALDQAWALSDGVQGDLVADTFVLGMLGRVWSDLGEYRRAVEYQRAAVESARRHASWVEGSMILNQARTSLVLGALDEAEARLEAALASPNPPPRRLASTLVVRANVRLARGQAADDLLSEAEALMVPGRRLVTWINLWLTRAVAGPAERGLEDVRRSLEVADRAALNGLWIAAQIRRAGLLLDLGRAAEALDCTGAALERSRTHTCDFYEGEVRWTRYRALEAVHHPDAPRDLQELSRWLMDAADRKVPPEYRRGFLEHNPVNRAILERSGGTRPSP